MFDEMASIRKPQAIGSSYDESKEAGDQALLKRESLVSEGWEPPSHGPPSASKVLHVRNIAPSTTEVSNCTTRPRASCHADAEFGCHVNIFVWSKRRTCRSSCYPLEGQT